MNFISNAPMRRPYLVFILITAATLGLIPNVGPGLEVATNMDHDAFSSILKREGLWQVIQQYPQVMTRFLITVIGLSFAWSLSLTGKVAGSLGIGIHIADLAILTAIMAFNLFALELAADTPLLAFIQGVAVLIGSYLTYAAYIDYQRETASQ